MASCLPSSLLASACIAFFARGVERLNPPSLFAEDGQVFLSEARNLGIAALWEPYAGYLHVLPRVVTLVLDPAPIVWLPTLYAVVALIGYLVLISPALSSRLDWLLPRRSDRATSFALLCLLPAATEGYGNLANLIFASGITLSLFALAADPDTAAGRYRELGAVALLGLSGPLGAILTPLFIWRWLRNGRPAHSFRVCLMVGLTGLIQVTFTVVTGRETPGGGSATLLLRVLAERLGGGWLFGNLNIFAATDWLLVDMLAYAWVVTAFAVTAYALRWTALVMWSGATLLLAGATWAYGSMMLSSVLSYQRHLLVPSAVVLILLVAAAAQASGGVRWIAVACIAMGAGGVITGFVPGAYPMPADLPALGACEIASCRVPIYDGRWVVHVR